METSCPHCGATLKMLAPGRALKCDYCGTQILTPLPRTSPVQAGAASANKDGLPPEYANLRRPRITSPVGAQGYGIMIFGIFWTLFSLIFLVLGVRSFANQFIQYSRIANEGLAARGIVTKLEIDDSGDSTSYYVYYQFSAAVNGHFTQINARESVPEAFYNTLRVEQQVDVLYAASDPNLYRLQSQSKQPNILFGLIFGGMGGLFVLIGIGMIYSAMKSNDQLKQLRMDGKETQGVVFERWKDTDSDGHPTYLVAYAFKVPDLQGNMKIITRAEQNRAIYDMVQVGQPVAIRYLPGQPDVCQVIVQPQSK
jgi:DNA-directed RNA polymerase subunit RPC12/RpoP